MAADAMAGPEAVVPDEPARRLYLAILGRGGRIPVPEVIDSDRAALDQLIGTGLVISNPLDATYMAVSPRAVTERVGAEMRSEAARLLLRAESLPDALEGLTRAYDSVPRDTVRVDEAEYIDGLARIRHRIAELVSDCKQELLTVQPGARRPETIALALQQDLDFVKRGGRLRTLYQPAVFGAPATVEYAAVMTGHGAAIRVLDEPFERMIIIDRTVAVVPASEDQSTAAFLTDPAALSFLIAVFERDWARADVIQWGEIDSSSATRSMPARVGRLLSQGFTQRMVAGRLGLSERTVAGHISRLRERYGAQTLFQLGWLMRGGGRDE